MKYTDKQIENAKRAYNEFLQLRTVESYQPEFIGRNTAEQRCEFHNLQVEKIQNGDKELEKEWKLFFLTEEVKKDQKENERKNKLAANKEASADVLAPVKKIKKIGEFGKWLNTSGNPYRKQHFSKSYSKDAVNAFLQTL
jgi:hypothetical protein